MLIRRREKKQTRKKKPSRKSIFEIYEPSELKRGHFTDVDNEVCSYMRLMLRHD
jgi:transcription elongation factor SPT6